MSWFDFFKFKGKEKEDSSAFVEKNRDKLNKKDNGVDINLSTLTNSSISDTSFNVSREATLGREAVEEIFSKRANCNIEQQKGWLFEAEVATTYNINAAKVGSESRAVILDSKVSTSEHGVKSNSGSAHDIEIIENGELTGNQAQLKAANNYKDAVKYQDSKKYKNMQRVVLEGQVDEFKNSKIDKRTVGRDTRKRLTEELSHTDENGNEIRSDKISKDYIKNRSEIRYNRIKTEIKETAKVTGSAAATAAATSIALNTIDDILEGREIDIARTAKNAGKAGLKVGATTLAKDVVVNKLKYSANAFQGAMIAIDVGAGVKNLFELAEKGTPKETIIEEAEALVLKVAVGLASNIALIFPGGAAASVAINYVAGKLIQKYFYSEAAMYLRELRVKNDEYDKLFRRLKSKEQELNNIIGKFLEAVDETCKQRVEVVEYLKVNANSESFATASLKLTKKIVEKTTDEDIDSLFDDELTI